MVLAERIERRPIFERTPQQSDYVEMWHGVENGKSPGNTPSKLKNILKKSEFVRKTLTNFKQKQLDNQLLNEKSFANKRIYKLVDK